jgi:RimJ/RimL family protein N-acetyltransferase
MLKGKQIKLVPLEKEDLGNSLLWANDMSLNSRMLRVLPVTKADQDSWYQSVVEDPSKVVFAIKTLKEDKHVGNAGIYHIDWVHRRGQFWILIADRDFRKRGVGEEVTGLMQKYAFDNLNLNKLYLNVSQDNKEAISLYEKLNFRREGIFQEHYFIEGKYVDIITMAILRKNFSYEK